MSKQGYPQKPFVMLYSRLNIIFVLNIFDIQFSMMFTKGCTKNQFLIRLMIFSQDIITGGLSLNLWPQIFSFFGCYLRTQNSLLWAKWAQINKNLKKRSCLIPWLVEYVLIFSGEIYENVLFSAWKNPILSNWPPTLIKIDRPFSDIRWCYHASMFIATVAFISSNVKIISNVPTAKFLLIPNSKIFHNLGPDFYWLK